ncbi:MAG: hypothetical protein ACK4UN_00795 [Limisphaerales bacterium]
MDHKEDIEHLKQLILQNEVILNEMKVLLAELDGANSRSKLKHGRPMSGLNSESESLSE